MLYNGRRKKRKARDMNIEIVTTLVGEKLNIWQSLITSAGLSTDERCDVTALVYDGEELVAAGSREGAVLKLLAVKETRQGEDLAAKVVTALRQNAIEAGYTHLFIYTKPKNEEIFKGLFFKTIVKTDTVLLMESRAGIDRFIEKISTGVSHTPSGAIVMNANPFTKGHRYLVERARAMCERLYVFVLSEDKSEFSAADRLEMVKRGVADIDGVAVLPTGPYLVSSATFPTYFLADRDSATEARCEVDIEVFGRYFKDAFCITRRFVGTEPYSPLTARYNAALRAGLGKFGIEYIEIPRLEESGSAISASRVRDMLREGNVDAALTLLPATTIGYLAERGIIKTTETEKNDA